jgi:hypothetical protein
MKPMHVRDMLARRTDLSTFVVHFTRRTNQPAHVNLRSMLRDRVIRAATAMGSAASRLDHGTAEWRSQRVVSFTESPLEQLHSFFIEFEEERRHKFRPYGLAFTKVQARHLGILPVWYSDVTRATDWRVNHVWRLIEEQTDAGTFVGSSIAQIAPFVETMGDGHRKEFWWEREWRHLGSFRFSYEQLALGLCPEERIDEFEAYMRLLAGRRRDPRAEGIRFVDPRWGLEQIVGTLAGVEARFLSPFTA